MAEQAEKEHGLPIMGDLKDIPLYESGIIRIPDFLIAQKAEAYKPHTISLGPLHFDDFQLKDGAEKKRQLLQDRFPYRVRHFKVLVDRMMDNLSRIRQWYNISYSFQEPSKLCTMMALDGTFLFEFLREISLSDSERSVILLSESRILPMIQQSADLEDTPNLENNLTRKFQEQEVQEVQEDILKLQNQIPLFVLRMIIQWEEETYQAMWQTILQQQEGKGKAKMLQDMILQGRPYTNQDLDIILKRAWHSLSPFDVGEEPLIWPGENAHLLGFLYANILGERTDLTQYNGEGNQKKILPARAVALDNKGVKFAAYTGPLNKICFDRNTWTFRLPRIEIAERTDAVMRNLMAFEIFARDDRAKPIKRYVELMDQLINTAEDVAVLRNRGVIQHHLGSDQEVANIWNEMRQGHDQEGKYGPIDIAIDEVIKFYGSYRIWFCEGVKKFFCY